MHCAPQNFKHIIHQVKARAQLREAVCWLRTTLSLHIGASLRRRQAQHVLVSEVVALAAASTPPALSESSELHVRSCRATRDRVVPNAASLPHRGGQQAVVSK